MYGSETWPMKKEDMQRLERTERMMVRWMCGVSLKNRISSDELKERLGIEGIDEIVERGRLRWFGHVERKPRENWVSACRKFEVAETKSKPLGHDLKRIFSVYPDKCRGGFTADVATI